VPKQRIDLRTVTATALTLVDRQGFAELSLAGVAEELGVRPSALYTYVPSLAALRDAMAVQATLNLGNAVRDSAVGRAGDDAIHRLAHSYRAFARDHPGQYASTLWPARQTDQALDQGLDQAIAGLIDVFARVIQGFGIAGEDAIHAARTARSAIHGFVALETAQGFPDLTDPDAGFEHLIATIVGSLR
jgi:AcrR family transcriptional regulator